MKKLTIIVHPFCDFKPWTRENIRFHSLSVKYSSLSSTPYPASESVESQLSSAGFPKSDVNLATNTLKMYKSGVDTLARGGRMLVLRSPRYDRFISPEQELIDYIIKVMPKDDIDFFPRLRDGTYIDDGDLEEFGQADICEMVLRLLDGEKNDIDVKVFGEILEACVLEEAEVIHDRARLEKPIKVYPGFCLGEDSISKKTKAPLLTDSDIKHLKGKVRIVA